MNGPALIDPDPGGAGLRRVLLARPRRLHGRAQLASVAVALVLLSLLGVGEARTPQNITFGGFLLLVVLASSWLFEMRAALLVSVAALGVPVVAYAVGGDDIVASEVELLALLVLAATVQLAVASIEWYESLLARRNRQLLDANASLQRFTADAAHEFRAPLAIVKTEVETALQRAETIVDYRRHLESVGGEVDRMAQSISSLLTLARADAGVLRASFRRTDLVDLLQEVVLRWAPLFAADRSTITAALPATGVLTCDPDLIVRVIDNLVENGLHAVSPGGSVEVGAHQEDGAWLLIVRDSGTGIDVEEATSLLDDPSRRPAARSRKAGGSGLGLALSAVIVRAHGGAIDVDSSLQGSVFTVRLPADPGDTDDVLPNMTKT